MPFTTQEIWRLRRELGYNVLNSGADAYVGITAVFDTIIQSYIEAEVATTSSTTVAAASTPTPSTIVLADATGFTAGARCVLDVDSRLESATLQSIAATSATFLLSLAHTGTYPVVVEGPITMAREMLGKIEDVKREISSSFGYGGLKKVDEIEFYDSGKTFLGALGDQLRFWRNELASLLNVANAWEYRRGGSCTTSVY